MYSKTAAFVAIGLVTLLILIGRSMAGKAQNAMTAQKDAGVTFIADNF
jgi:hypothetical protein